MVGGFFSAIHAVGLALAAPLLIWSFKRHLTKEKFGKDNKENLFKKYLKRVSYRGIYRSNADLYELKKNFEQETIHHQIEQKFVENQL